MSQLSRLQQAFERRGKLRTTRRRRASIQLEVLESRQLLTYSAVLVGSSAIFTGSGTGDTLSFDASTGLLRHNPLTAPAGQSFASDFDFDSFVPGDQTLAQSAASTVLAASFGAGADTVNVGSPTVPASQLLAGFTFVNFGTGNDVLNVDDSGNALPDTYTVSSTGVTATSLNVANLALFHGGVNLFTGTAANTVNIPSSFTNQPVSETGKGPLTVNLGSGGTLQNLNAAVTLSNPTGTTTVVANDSADVSAQTATIAATGITGLAPSAIHFGSANVTSLTVDGGSGGNVFNVLKTFPTTVINTGSGGDTLSVTAAGMAATGSFVTNGAAGFDTLNVDANGNTAVVTPGVIQIGALQPINYTNYDAISITNAVNTPPVVTATAFPATAGIMANDVTAATFTDADGGPASLYTATIHWGDGTNRAGTILQDASTPSIFYVIGSHLYQTPGSKPLTVTVADHGGGTSTTIIGGIPVTITSSPGVPVTSAPVPELVADASITVTGVNITATEAAPISATTTLATFTSSNPFATSANYTASIDWGDGSPIQLGGITSIGTSPSGVTFSVAPTTPHTYTKEGTYPVTVTITTAAGTAGIAHSLAKVADGSIDVTGGTVTATAGTPIPTQQVATFVDNGGAEPVNSYKIFINWGDGSTGPGFISSFTVGVGGVTTFVVSGHHIYTTPTTVPITGAVTVTTAGGTVGSNTFTATVHGLNANFGIIAVDEDQPLNNVVLATLSSNGGPPAQPSYYTATANWGDGTPITRLAVNSSFELIGSHTYRESGVYPVVITVATTGNPNVLTFTRGIIVNDIPINLQGHLDAASDSGISDTDGITNVVQPTFLGTSEPLSIIAIDAVPGAGGNVLRLGTATTDASGAWSITTTSPLADGAYTINAHAVDRNGKTTADIVIGNILIDTIGPRVTDFVFNRPGGEILTTLQDESSGLAQQTIIDNVNYSITKPHTRNGTYLFTSLTASPSNGPTTAQTVTGVINNHMQLRGGTYTVTVKSGGITDVAGNALDGEFYGYVPSGNGHPGGDFVAVIDTVHARILSPLPLQGFGSPNLPPGALLPAYVIRPGKTIRPIGPRFRHGIGPVAGLPPARPPQQSAHHAALAGIFRHKAHPTKTT